MVEVEVESSTLTCVGGPLPYAGKKFSVALSLRGVKGIFLPLGKKIEIQERSLLVLP
jgi:hypothetical protein